MFAVIFCALGDEGESYHKGIMRILATILGCSMSLVFTSVFNDQRWAFAGAVLIWVMICTWNMQGNRRWYIWFLGGWLTILMPIYSAEQPDLAFEVVILRLEETMLGVIVYTIVVNVIFPSRQHSEFGGRLRDQIAALRAVLADVDGAFQGKARKSGGIGALTGSAQALHASFRNQIDVSITESFETIENRDAWRHMITGLDAIIGLLCQLRPAVSGPHVEAIHANLPDLGSIYREIDRRLGETLAVLDGATEAEPPRPVTMPAMAPLREGDSVFDRGTVLNGLVIIAEIERRSAALLDAAMEAKGLSGRKLQAEPPLPDPARTILPDPERLAAAGRTGLVYWLAFLTFIYFPDLPDATTVVLLATIFAMLKGMNPVTSLGPIVIVGNLTIIVAGIIQMVIMPMFSSFWGLAVIVFLFMFIFGALLSEPKYMALRFIALGYASMIMAISNDQVYDFYDTANFLVGFQIPFMLIWLTEIFPVSFRPEAVIQRLLRRYMRSLRWLIEDGERQVPGGWWRRQLRGWHLRGILKTPEQMKPWIGAAPAASLDEAAKAQANAMCDALQDAANGIEALLHHGRNRHDLAGGLRASMLAWREAVERLSDDFHERPGELPAVESLEERLNTRLGIVERDMKQLIDNRADFDATTKGRALLRELSAWRGISEALIRATGAARLVDWARLKEARF